MFRNISIGVYYAGDSLIHRLQARTKLLVLFWLIIFLTIANQREWHFAPYIVLVMLLLLSIGLSGISPFYLLRRMWLLLLLALLGAIPTVIFPSHPASKRLYTFAPLLVSYGLLHWVILIYSIILAMYILLLVLPLPAVRALRKQRWLRRMRMPLLLLTLVVLVVLWLTWSAPLSQTFPIGPIVITYESVWLLMTFYTIFLVFYAFSLLLTMTTSPIALIEGLTLLLAPLRWLKLPVDDFALMALIALRFIPTLIDEAEQLVKAQTSRGADLSEGTLRERMQSLAMLFVPFLQGALRRAADLATALESRGYEVEGKQTRLYERALGLVDYGVVGIVLVVTIGALVF